MVLDLDERHVIKTDARCWMLRGKKGSILSACRGKVRGPFYYSSPRDLADALVRHGLVAQDQYQPCEGMARIIRETSERIGKLTPGQIVTFDHGQFQIHHRECDGGFEEILLRTSRKSVTRLKEGDHHIVAFCVDLDHAFTKAITVSLLADRRQIRYDDFNRVTENASRSMLEDAMVHSAGHVKELAAA